MSLRSATPCQWMVVGSGSRLVSSARSTSPARSRTAGPGTVWLYAQVVTLVPARSRVAGPATRSTWWVAAPGLWRRASAWATAAADGPTGRGVDGPVQAPAASPVAPAPATTRNCLRDTPATPTS
jgi:hypothetical protein